MSESNPLKQLQVIYLSNFLNSLTPSEAFF